MSKRGLHPHFECQVQRKVPFPSQRICDPWLVVLKKDAGQEAEIRKRKETKKKMYNDKTNKQQAQASAGMPQSAQQYPAHMGSDGVSSAG